jgi:hypothetical protein
LTIAAGSIVTTAVALIVMCIRPSSPGEIQSGAAPARIRTNPRRVLAFAARPTNKNFFECLGSYHVNVVNLSASGQKAKAVLSRKRSNHSSQRQLHFIHKK